MAKPRNINANAITEETVPDDLSIETRPPEPIPSTDESAEFHAARILILLKIAGGRSSKIVGRTKIAKLDFFVRYPTYLAKAINLLNITADIKTGPRPESPMIRYKYGPWDSKYYDIFALLIAKDLISVYPTEKGDAFQLTERGEFAVKELESPEFEGIIERCRIVNKIFGNRGGTWIKNFIYENFPEVVAKSIGKEIDQ
jgi:hypothetical protein